MAKKKSMTYKVVCNLNNKDFYTDNEQEAKDMFEQYKKEYGDGIRLYEAIKPKAEDDAPEWETIDYYDEDEAETQPAQVKPTTVGELPEHTPGEWSVEEVEIGKLQIGAGELDIICFMQNYHPQVKANARLIASAPLLLEALKEASEILVHSVNNEKGNKIKTAILKECPDVRFAMNKIREAIASATK